MMPRSIPDSLIDRFLLHADRSGGDNECWPWTGGRFSNGYGRLWFGNKALSAHRVSHELFVGPIPAGMFVCHNCPEGDNRWCVNPRHLWIGTNADNMRDKIAKGRAQGNKPIPEVQESLSATYEGLSRSHPGQNNPFSKLTDDDVRDIRARYKFRVVTAQMLADEYGVSEGAVSRIIRRVSWAHLD